MNENITVSNTDELAELRSELATLRRYFVITLWVLLLIGGSLNFYLLRQWVTVSKEANNMKLVVNQYNTQQAPLINKIYSSLYEYGRKHADVNQILLKYGVTPASGGANQSAAPKGPAQK
jgi:hypothetical protein